MSRKQDLERIQIWFDEYNRRYFGSRLKQIKVCWDSCIDIFGLMGAYSRKRNRIRVNNALIQWETMAKLVLLHEMVHADLASRKVRYFTTHGKHFNQEMLRLAKAGALNGLW